METELKRHGGWCACGSQIIIYVIHRSVFVKTVIQNFVSFVNENFFTFSLTMTESLSFLKKIVPAYHLEQGQTPAFKVHSSMTIYLWLLVIQFQLPTVEVMASLVSKLQMILEQGHREYQEMLAGHVPIQMGILKDTTEGNDHPLLILSNVSYRPFIIAVIGTVEALAIVPTKILTQNKHGKDGGSVHERREPSKVSGGCRARSTSRASTLSSESDGSSSGSSRSLSVSAQSGVVHGDDRKQTPKPRKNPQDQITTGSGCSPSPCKKIKSLPSNPENHKGKGKSVYYWSYYKCPSPTLTMNEELWSDNQEFVQILIDSVEQVKIPASSLPTIPVTSIPMPTSSLVALLEAVQGACANVLRFFKQPPSK